MVVKHPVDEQTAQRFIDYDYHDRGMMKWHGFMISDHSEYIERAKHNHNVKVLPAQPLAKIKTLIQKAMNKNVDVIIQPNYLEHNQTIELVGRIKGIQQMELYLKTKRGVESIEIESIRNIRYF